MSTCRASIREAEHKAQGVLDFHQKELAAYLARARGPVAQGSGESAVKIKLGPRPSGETGAGGVQGIRRSGRSRSGRAEPRISATTAATGRWGTPSRRGSFVHDAFADEDGNPWFTSNVPNRRITIGRIDARSGEVKFLKLNNNANGLAANTHGMTRDPAGNHLVQRQYRPRRPRQARPEVREDRRLYSAERHVADRWCHHGGLGRQGQDLDVVHGWGADV